MKSGENLVGIVDKTIKERNDFFYEHTYSGSPQLPKVEGVVSTKMKYMNYTEHGYEELYNLEKDPHETNNLAGNPKYKRTLSELRTRYKYLKKTVQ